MKERSTTRLDQLCSNAILFALAILLGAWSVFTLYQANESYESATAQAAQNLNAANEIANEIGRLNTTTLATMANKLNEAAKGPWSPECRQAISKIKERLQLNNDATQPAQSLIDRCERELTNSKWRASLAYVRTLALATVPMCIAVALIMTLLSKIRRAKPLVPALPNHTEEAAI